MVSPSQPDLPSYLSQPPLTQYNAWGEDDQDVIQQEQRRRSNEAKALVKKYKTWFSFKIKSIMYHFQFLTSYGIFSRTRTKEYSLITKCIAEFLGDFTFVFVGKKFEGFFSIFYFEGKTYPNLRFKYAFSGTMQAYVPNKSNDDITHAALAHGFTIFIIVASLGHIR